MHYDNDIAVTGEFEIEEKAEPIVALDRYDENTKVKLAYRPTKEVSYIDDSAYGIYACVLNEDNEQPPEFILTGYLSDRLDIGHTYVSDGVVVVSKGQKQFKIENISQIMPDCGAGVLAYARSLNWIRSGADILYEAYGKDTLKVICENPDSVKTLLPDIDDARLDEWKRQIENGRDDLGFLSELISIGLKPRQARLLVDKYGADTMNKVCSNPYCLIGKLPGYTFAKCDEAASRLKLEPDCAERMMAGVNTAMLRLMSGGSTKLRRDDVLGATIETLSVRMSVSDMYAAVRSGNKNYEASFGSRSWTIPVSRIRVDLTAYNAAKTAADKEQARTILWYMEPDKAADVIDGMIADGELVADKQGGNYLMLNKYYTEEHEIASCVTGMIDAAVPATGFDARASLSAYCKENNVSLEQMQAEAVLHICSSVGGFHIINGAAGCGKTFTIKVALNILRRMYKALGRELEVTIVAPTGKAARVAHNSTGIDAYTVHRLLQYRSDGTFFYNATNKLPYNCIVVDETSMLDTNIAYSLFTAIEPGTVVVLMGDVNQLPSIGPGNVLHDLTESGMVDVVTLNVIKRQGQDSGIVINARNIIAGESVTSQKETMDSLVVGTDGEPMMLEKMMRYVDKSMCDVGVDGIQILSPMRNGLTGTNHINYLMQAKLNAEATNFPQFPCVKFQIENNWVVTDIELFFKVGDRVINTKNDYSIPWYKAKGGQLYRDDDKCGLTNGEVGTIVYTGNDIDDNGDRVKRMVVQFPSDLKNEYKYIIFDNDFQVLSHAYAITIHRSQGSEWPVVIVMLSKRHRRMLDKNLLYTGLTRSKSKAVIISDKETLDYAVANSQAGKRCTGLLTRLQEFAARSIQTENSP